MPGWRNQQNAENDRLSPFSLLQPETERRSHTSRSSHSCTERLYGTETNDRGMVVTMRTSGTDVVTIEFETNEKDG